MGILKYNKLLSYLLVMLVNLSCKNLDAKRTNLIFIVLFTIVIGWEHLFPNEVAEFTHHAFMHLAAKRSIKFCYLAMGVSIFSYIFMDNFLSKVLSIYEVFLTLIYLRFFEKCIFYREGETLLFCGF